jgi:hypothetical protein
MSKKEVILRKHSADSQQPVYEARESEVWRKDPNGHVHLAVVIRAVDGNLDAHTRKLARICAKALNELTKEN